MDAGLCVWKGYWMKSLTGMSDEVFGKDARLTFRQGRQNRCLQGMIG